MILDSDVLIEILRSSPQTSRWVAAQASAGETLRYSPVSRAEIGAGVTRGEGDRVEALIAGLDAVGTVQYGERLATFTRPHYPGITQVSLRQTAS
jgi:predicted nucleic acid-binding protein